MTANPTILRGSVVEHHAAFLDELNRLQRRLGTAPNTDSIKRLAVHVDHAHRYSTARASQPLRPKVDHGDTDGAAGQVEWDAALVQSAYAAVVRGEIPPADAPHPAHDSLWTRIKEWVLKHTIPDLQRYDDFDARWIRALAERIGTVPVAFPAATPAQIELPSKVRIAIVGDWGTGLPESDLIASHLVAGAPDYIIHLGDVYYAGTPAEEERFLDHWPGQPGKSLTLNSNHEMYGGGHGYFDVALRSETFKLQNGCSYFSLTNKYFVILGLDTAYHAKDFLFEEGFLDEALQLPFVRTHVRTAREQHRNIVVLTHHNGLGLDNKPTLLWGQLRREIPGAFTWIWGHLHSGVAHAEVDQVSGRCVGHGGVPYSPFSSDERTTYAWAETERANDAREPNRALNGYYVLELDGANLREAFHDERGRVRWASSSDAT